MKHTQLPFPFSARYARLAQTALAAFGLALGMLAYAHLHAAEPEMAQAEVTIAGQIIKLDVADSPALQARGLGGRASLAPNRGMIFVYAKRSRQSFWMLDMHFPIDIVWLDNGRVVHIEHNVPPPAPGATSAELPTYEPEAEANLVLELAAGRARALGIKPGQRLEFRFNLQ